MQLFHKQKILKKMVPVLSQVMLLDVFVSCKRVFLVMEYAAKGNLKSLYRAYAARNMSSPYLAEETARFYFQEILSGLQFLHDKNIAHR